VRLAFASDWPVVKTGPLLGMFAAAFRRNPGESNSFVGLSPRFPAGHNSWSGKAGRLGGTTGKLEVCTTVLLIFLHTLVSVICRPETRHIVVCFMLSSEIWGWLPYSG